jgi:hypothetical protein
MLMLTPVAAGIPGYEELGEARALSMLLTVSWWIVEAYEQRTGKYGLLIYETDGTPVAFLTNVVELDALCAVIVWSIDICSYWSACASIVEEWRAIHQIAQTLMTQQCLREEVQR